MGCTRISRLHNNTAANENQQRITDGWRASTSEEIPKKEKRMSEDDGGRTRDHQTGKTAIAIDTILLRVACTACPAGDRPVQGRARDAAAQSERGPERPAQDGHQGGRREGLVRLPRRARRGKAQVQTVLLPHLMDNRGASQQINYS